jgi:large subunit ribosomal protein L13
VLVKIVAKYTFFTKWSCYLCTPKNKFLNIYNNMMKHLSYKTQFAKKETHVREWFVVDATDQTLGRMCAQIASVLRGKHKPTYTPHFDAGDYVIVLNSRKINITGNKLEQKNYINFSGYPGGKKEETAKNLLNRRPNVLIERAVKGMLPKNRLGRAMYKKLVVIDGDTHPHGAQKPKELKF